MKYFFLYLNNHKVIDYDYDKHKHSFHSNIENCGDWYFHSLYYLKSM